MRTTALQEKLDHLPSSPGVYLMKDARGSVIYVGKAAVLKHRVRSYFQSQKGTEKKTRMLIEEIVDVDIVQTDTEAEAFILEDTLIKRYHPRFNIRLRDDKRYPYLKITDESFPRIMIVRRRRSDGARYFGPYTNVKAMRATLKLAQKLFPLRTCSLVFPLKKPRRPCLNYHIGRCMAPCADLIDQTEYAQIIQGASMLFQGRLAGLLSDLRRRMEGAANAQQFEQAAKLRDQINALSHSLERQSVALSDQTDRDVLGVSMSSEYACVVVFPVRGGRLSGREAFHLHAPGEPTEADVLSAFVSQYYTVAGMIPREVLLPIGIERRDELAGWLSSLKGRRVSLRIPKRGEKRRLVELAIENARFALKAERAETSLREEASTALSDLVDALSLRAFPHRIEAFDVSNTRGEEPTASMVVFRNGQAHRNAYRRFKIRRSGKPDDYAMMAEVLRRRFRRGMTELNDPTLSHPKFAEFPDLLLVDGGRGQLNVALSVLEELKISDIDVIGLAKRHEEIFQPGTASSLRLPSDSKALLLLRQIRDEAHRFAVSYHRHLRARRTLASELDDIAGIGPKRKEVLIKAFGSLQRLSGASVEDIAAVPGIPRPLAVHIANRLQPTSSPRAS